MDADKFPLSPQQRRLWRLQSGGESYESRLSLLIQGEMHVDELRAALQDLIARHEILRTTFVDGAGMSEPLQVIHPTGMLALNEGAPTALGDSAGTLPLRAWLERVDVGSHRLTVALPALCADTAALRLMALELSQAYGARVGSGALVNEPMQFADVASWQNDLLQGDYAATGRAYWRGRLVQLDAVAERLPFGPGAGGLFAPHRLAVPGVEGLGARIDQVAGTHGLSDRAFLLTCWQVLLERLTGSKGGIVGLAADCRTAAELQEVLGPVGRYLPFRLAYESGEAFAAAIARTEQTLQEMETFQEFFAWEGVGVTEPDSYLGGFAYEQTLAPWGSGGLTWQVEELVAWTDRFGLQLICHRYEGDLTLHLAFDRARFQQSEMERLANWLSVLVEGALKDPATPVAKLEFLTAAERESLLYGLNQTAAAVPAVCAHRLFEEQVTRTPVHIAVRSGRQELTYTELNQRANRLAHYLRKQGVGPDTIVGICIDRSVEMLVAILAVWKAGGAYLPLEPGYPVERLAFMLADSNLSLVLTRAALCELLPSSGPERFCLDSDWGRLDQEPAENLTGGAEPKHLAYVIYTSGSTGRPKGVLIEHGGLVNYLTWAVSAYRVTEGGGAPVHSPLGFDLTVTGLFPPLLCGRTVDLLPDGTGADVLADLIRGTGYSLVKLTPAHLELLSQVLPAEAAGAWARALVIGGEQLLGEQIRFWQRHAPQTRLINEYGPTETVVGCCVYEVPEGERVEGAVPIGRPIANTHLYILDEQLLPVPVGMVGELYIGGAGVARGYLNRPDLTAERFLASPFESGERLYRTGDLCRYRPDGVIEYLGRVDDQVKIHGFRIELGEIEAALVAHPGVQTCAVIARTEANGARRLVAYLVPAREAAISADQLREHLAQSLPAYMVPAAFVTMTTLPLTVNGKVDRRALPAPDQVGPTRVAPRNALEESLAAIWAEVLEVEQVGIFDSFQELGGDSILGIQLISRMRSAFQVEVPVRAVFDHPTIAASAAFVEELLLKQLAAEVEGLSDEEVARRMAEVVAEEEKVRG